MNEYDLLVQSLFFLPETSDLRVGLFRFNSEVYVTEMMRCTILLAFMACLQTQAKGIYFNKQKPEAINHIEALQTSSDVQFKDITIHRTYSVESVNATVNFDNSLISTQMSDTADGFSYSLTTYQNSDLTTIFTSLLNQTIVLSPSDVFSNTLQHSSMNDGTVSSLFSHSFNSSLNCDPQATQLSQEHESLSFLSSTLELCADCEILTFSAIFPDDSTLLSVLVAPDSYFKQKENQTVLQSVDNQGISTTKVVSMSSSFISFLASTSATPTTKSKPQISPGKPSRAGASGEKSMMALSEGMLPGAKVAIGIAVTLCILSVVTAGVIAYRRYTTSHRNLKSSSTSGVRYNKTSYNEGEGMLITPSSH